MKLKKIVSLALAGVLAVSMLAGCKSTGAADSSASSEAPAATGLLGKVMAELDESVTDKVTFTASSELQNVMEVLAKDDSNSLANVTGANIVRRDPQIADGSTVLTARQNPNTTATSTDSKAQTKVFVAKATGEDEALVIRQLVYGVEHAAVSGETKNTIADLPDYSNPTVLSATTEQYQYNFDYTGTMALISDKDVTTGLTTYVLAFTITRTPTKAPYQA